MNPNIAEAGRKTRFKKGQPSANPGGRPRKLVTEAYEKVVKKVLPEDLRLALNLPKGATHGDAIALGQARAAIKGKTDAAREIADRLEGKVTDSVELSGAVSVEVVIRHIGRRRETK